MASDSLIEQISNDGRTLACIVRGETAPPQTTFLTPPDYNLQMGFVVYASGGEVPRHVHHPVERNIVGTAEVLLVRSGHCLMDTYDDDHSLVLTSELFRGDIIMMIAGGHGFRMLEDTTLLEIKQGPYGGVEEKERF